MKRKLFITTAKVHAGFIFKGNFSPFILPQKLFVLVLFKKLKAKQNAFATWVLADEIVGIKPTQTIARAVVAN